MDIGVLTFVVVGCAALTIRWSLAVIRQRRQGNVSSFSVGVLIVLVFLTTLGWYFEASHHQRQALATEAIQVVSHSPDARVNCQRFTASLTSTSIYDGFVYHNDPDVAHLKRDICVDLASYARSDKRNPTLEQIAAVQLIAHEGMHVNGLWDEARAECYGIQFTHLVAEQLGATPEQARALQLRYYEEIYPHMHSTYRSNECRLGGALDLNPDRDVFP